jgi:hypothetical protein
MLFEEVRCQKRQIQTLVEKKRLRHSFEISATIFRGVRQSLLGRHRE